MEFGLSQDQLLLDDSVRKYLSSEVSIDVVRKIASGEQSDSDIWRGLAEMGLAGIIIPEAQGGAELGMLDAVAIAEAAGLRRVSRALLEHRYYVRTSAQ